MIIFGKYAAILILVLPSIFCHACFAQNIELVNLEKNQKYSASGAFAFSKDDISVFALGAAVPGAVIFTFRSIGPPLRKEFETPDGVAYLGSTSVQGKELSILHGINTNGDNIIFSINRNSGKMVRNNKISASNIQLSSAGNEILVFGKNKGKPWISLLDKDLKITRTFFYTNKFENANYVSAVAAIEGYYYAAIESSDKTKNINLVKINGAMSKKILEKNFQGQGATLSKFGELLVLSLNTLDGPYIIALNNNLEQVWSRKLYEPVGGGTRRRVAVHQEKLFSVGGNDDRLLVQEFSKTGNLMFAASDVLRLPPSNSPYAYALIGNTMHIVGSFTQPFSEQKNNGIESIAHFTVGIEKN